MASPRPTVPRQPARVQIRLSPALAQESDVRDVQLAVARANARLATELGLPMPGAEAQESTLADRKFRVELDGVPLGETEIPAASLLLRDDPEHAELAGVPAAPGRHLLGLPQVHWVPASQRAALQEAGVGFLKPAEALGAPSPPWRSGEHALGLKAKTLASPCTGSGGASRSTSPRQDRARRAGG